MAHGGPKARIENDPNRSEIVKAIAGGTSVRSVAAKFGYTMSAIQRFKTSHLTKAMDKREEGRKLRDADAVSARLESILAQTEKLERALGAELQDPEDPEKFTADLRASELDLIYGEPVEGESGKVRMVRKRGTVQNILERIARAGKEIYVVQSKREDMRKLLIDAHRGMVDLLTALSKVLGIIKPPQMNIQVNVALAQHPEFFPFLQIVYGALAPFPDAKRALVDAMEREAIARGEMEPPRTVAALPAQIDPLLLR
jgi:transposase